MKIGKRKWLSSMAVALFATGLLVVLGSLSEARERLRGRFAERIGADLGPKVPGSEMIAFGPDPLQTLDVWRAKDSPGRAPLIVFVHGGGWKRGDKDNATGRFKAEHYSNQGYAFASINYRLVPAATVEQQAADVAAAVKALIDHADSLGIDRTKIVLMGHSAGAHLVALVGADVSYLKAVGLSFANIAGVVAIDGAAYDAPEQMRDGPSIMHETYFQAFSSDPARQRVLSPTTYAAAPNAAEFLLLYIQRLDGIRQAQALGVALAQGGSRVEYGSFAGGGLKGHAEINRQLGDTSYAPTVTVDAWLRRVFGRDSKAACEDAVC